MKEDIAVRYHLQLGVAGMVDGPTQPTMSIDERLSRLRLYQSRWRRLSYTRRSTVNFHKGPVWELASGVIAQGASFFDEGGRQRVQKFFFSELPGDARGHPRRKEWSLGGYDFTLRDFTIDPTQDLLVIM